ncbi:MAG: hypothetical protein IPM94_00835 [bacterium]|nr:hypothetical protein [bacterium]
MPVVCLIGQGCSGAGTEFAMMMKDMPNVTLVGRPTRGGTGGMARFNLPIGSQVNFPSRSLWSSDHELVNDSHGLQPGILSSRMSQCSDPSREDLGSQMVPLCW